ncbi:MAG: histidine kinase [Bacteroidetes bacterium]|nr:histidine kinase [Bacteroidota bacterium]
MQRFVYFTAHFLFWTVFAALSWMSFSANPLELAFVKSNLEAPVMLILWAAISFYAFYFFVQPLFLDTKKYFTYFVVSVLSSITMSALFTVIFWFSYPVFTEHALQKFSEGIIGSFIISQCGSLLRGFVNWNKNLQYKAALENQSLRNELAMLKAQLSPHFLFNTLNNIDSLIYKSQDEASASLIKLSGLLRYMLYESESKEVFIAKEIEYIQQLVELQQLRFAEKNFVTLDIQNSCSEFKIAPLLFLPLIENAFKFVSNPATMPAIHIELNVQNNGVKLICCNYFVPKNAGTVQTQGGIGLVNTRRRLELLYPNRFNLQVSQTHNMFTVELNIERI